MCRVYPTCGALICATRASPSCGGIHVLLAMRMKGDAARDRHAQRSRVPGLAREHAENDADLLQRLGVFAADILAEDQLGIGGAMQPAIVLDLVLQLARRPAGIAEREDRAARSLSACDRLENVERGGQADALVDRQGR